MRPMMTTKARVKRLIETLAFQLAEFYETKAERSEIVSEATNIVDRLANTAAGDFLNAQREDPFDELVALEAALFHVTGQLRKYLQKRKAVKIGG